MTKSAYTPWVFLIYIFCLNAFTLADVNLKLRNNGPAILDSEITFYAELEGDIPQDEFEFTFEDNTKGNVSHKHSVTSNRSAELTLLVSKDFYRDSIFSMKVSVYRTLFHVIPQRVAFGKMSFTLTDSINGELLVTGEKSQYIPAGGMVNFTFILYDPSHYFDNADWEYIWKFNSTTMFYRKDSVLFNVSSEGSLMVTLSLFANVQNNQTSTIKSGSLDQIYTALRPISNVTVQGSVWLKRGEVMNLAVSCKGTGPYQYCRRVFLDNKTDICAGQDFITTTQCSFLVIHYFKSAGKYNVGILIKNKINQINHTMEIQIYDVDKKPQLSTIIFPIASCCLGIVIIVIGAAYHLQQRRTYTIEVANFDFQEPVLLMERSFISRVRESFKDALENYRRQRHSREKWTVNGSSRTTPIPQAYTAIY